MERRTDLRWRYRFPSDYLIHWVPGTGYERTRWDDVVRLRKPLNREIKTESMTHGICLTTSVCRIYSGLRWEYAGQCLRDLDQYLESSETPMPLYNSRLEGLHLYALKTTPYCTSILEYIEILRRTDAQI